MNPVKLAAYVRNFVFGVEDSLVSTVGLLSGVAVADVSRETLILTGIVLIFVEAFSMGVGSFLSEHSVEEIEGGEKRSRLTIKGAIIMFFSYFLAGFIPLAPYVLIGGPSAFWISILAALVTLFILGIVSARITQQRILIHGIQMLVIGGVAVLVGAGVGHFINTL